MKMQSTQARGRAHRTLMARVRTFQRMALGGSSAAVLFFVALLSLGAFSLTPALARGDEPQAAATLSPDEVERQAEAIARSIMSPFCPGRTVSACPVAGPWRDDIRKWVSEGVDAAQIRERLAERAPEHNLMGVPKNRLGWALPVGLGVLALGILIFLLRYLVGPRAAGSSPSDVKPAESPASPKANASPATTSRANGEDYDERLEQELETFER